MAAFILVPGAWHGAWCWEIIAPLLEAAGHRVLTPELTQTPPGANPLPLWAGQVAALAETTRQPVILVGHSRAGLIISAAAALTPVAKLVYLSGFLLPAGESMETAMARPEAGGAPDYLRPARGRCLAVAAESIIPRFYHQASPETANSAAARLRPEPLGIFSAPATPPPSHIPRAYIECAQDRVVPLALQRHMQKTLPCAQVFTLPADHSPFFSMPEQLAATLLAIR